MHVLDPDRTDGVPERPGDVTPDGDVRVADVEQDDRSVESPDDGDGHLPGEARREPPEQEAPDEVTVPPRRGLVRIRGMRIRRIRVGSVATIAAVFFGLGYAAVLLSGVLAWNLADQLGLIAEVEQLVVSSLGLETFEVAGAALFEVFAVVTGVLALFAFVVTVLLALVYNAATAVLGGIALETGPLRRPRRVFSLRHRRFVKIS